MAAKFDDYLT